MAFVARAGAPAGPLVRFLPPIGGPRAHPLVAARSSRVPLIVRWSSDQIDARSFGVLPLAPHIGSIWLAPDRIESYAAAHPELGLFFAPPRRPLLDISKKW